MSLIDRIKAHEGFSPQAYVCPTGHLTIGYGTRIDEGSNGIDADLLEMQLQRDLGRIEQRLLGLPWASDLDAVRRGVCVEMAYQMGITGLLKFKRMIAAIEAKDWRWASDEMISSRWYEQTPNRAAKLAEIMLTGVES